LSPNRDLMGWTPGLGVNVRLLSGSSSAILMASHAVDIVLCPVAVCRYPVK